MDPQPGRRLGARVGEKTKTNQPFRSPDFGVVNKATPPNSVRTASSETQPEDKARVTLVVGLGARITAEAEQEVEPEINRTQQPGQEEEQEEPFRRLLERGVQRWA